MKKSIILLTALMVTSTAFETLCKSDKKKQNKKTTTAVEKKEAPKKSNATLSEEEYNFWDSKAEVLAQVYESKNQEKFPNRGGLRTQQVESIQSLKGAIKELEAQKDEYWKKEGATLAEAYIERHEDVTDAQKAHKEVIKILKQIKKDWKAELIAAESGPEAAYL